uniref:Uncharacterized protein n=1 Tax=uncultured marine group II/III euryarchaeote KM3_182_B06 TaxID=1457946 RepID=A0A075GSY9_9EURY|nr:hypothetical protein [uncultured marine group II/III euryarchaeote KM3_182_B06]
MNLVQEAMTSEKENSAEKRKPKDGRKRIVTTLFTWILLNAIWTGALAGESLNEVMDHDSRFIGNYYLDVPDMLKLNHTVPTFVECDYKARNNTEPQLVRLIHQSPNGDTETLWEGTTDVDECPSMMLELVPGGHNFITQVIEIDGVRNQTPSKLVSSELYLSMKIYEPIHTEGYIVANVLGLCLFVGERGVRAMLKRRNASNVRDMPLHKLRQKEEWESIVESMSGGDTADVEDLIKFTSTEDSSAEKRRQKMRHDFAAQAATTDDDVEEFTDDSKVKDDDELGEGTTEGLEGEVKPDPSLRTVRDIWERIEDDDN